MKKFMLILKIVLLGLRINSRERNTIFISYYGHVDLLRVDVHTEGWEKNIYPDYTKEVYLASEDVEKELRLIIGELKAIGIEEEEEYVPKDENEFDIFELINEERNLDEAWEEKNG